MWFNKLIMRKPEGIWVDFPLVPVKVQAGQKYILVLKNEYIKLKEELKNLQEAMA